MMQHKDAVYRQIARVCGNYDDAQDVLVQTLLTAYRAMDQVRDPEAMRGWLATIGRRICRRMKQKEALAPLIELSHDPAYEHPIHEEMEADRMKQCVSAALESLPPVYREAYVLREIQGLSTEEAAEQIGIHPRNLKSRLHRARGMIRKHFDSGICGNVSSD